MSSALINASTPLDLQSWRELRSIAPRIASNHLPWLSETLTRLLIITFPQDQEHNDEIYFSNKGKVDI